MGFALLGACAADPAPRPGPAPAPPSAPARPAAPAPSGGTPTPTPTPTPAPDRERLPLALVVHAGVRPGVDLQDQSEEDLVWIREGFLNSPVNHGPLVVHGHTPVRHATHYGNRLNLDSGAAYGGALTAVRLDADGAWLLSDTGPQPLTPRPSDADEA